MAKEFTYLKRQMFDLLEKHTGKPYERIEREFDRDRYMSSNEAREFGMIDMVVDQRVPATSETRALSEASELLYTESVRDRV